MDGLLRQGSKAYRILWALLATEDQQSPVAHMGANSKTFVCVLI